MAQPDPDLQLSPELDRIMWIDCKMTGLESERHVIVKIAALVTDANLNVPGEDVDIVVHVSETELAQMDDFVTKMHTKSGLDQEIRASKTNVADVEQAVLDYIRQRTPELRTTPLAGNSIASDHKFIHCYMPELDQHLHYRMVDVSPFEELARRWYPQVLKGAPEKGLVHRALTDIKESIRELDYCRCATLLPHPGPEGDVISAASKESTEEYGEIRG